MKKFIITLLVLLALAFGLHTAYYSYGLYVDLRPNAPVSAPVIAEEGGLFIDRGNGLEEFVVRGVHLGSTLPGHWAADYAIDEETYLRWFDQISDLGANTIRLSAIMDQDFYDALYAFNTSREDPLYLLHGIPVNDYILSSSVDAYDDAFREPFLRDCRTLVNLLHGRQSIPTNENGMGYGSYRKDVSPWVLGYVLGTEWDALTVTYTNQIHDEMPPYQGVYLSAAPEATAFESLLAEFCDNLITYESRRYKEQRPVSFANRAVTDPFLYPDEIQTYYSKCAQLDAEHLIASDHFQAGLFAAYQADLHDPDYLGSVLQGVPAVPTPLYQPTPFGGTDYKTALTGSYEADYLDPQGELNTYYAYLQMLNRHHTMPVVITGFGVSSSRAPAHRDYGPMSEAQQGEALISCWQDLRNAGCAGGCVSAWQDEWSKRTWNTLHAVDLDQTAYWSDYQSRDQFFGLLTFEPGEKTSVCCVDGDFSEWQAEDLVTDCNSYKLSAKYDEKYLYLCVQAETPLSADSPLFIPIDTTPKSGGAGCSGTDLTFDRSADFLLYIDGAANSRLLVQERYETLRAMMSYEVSGTNAYLKPPAADSTTFVPIHLLLESSGELVDGIWQVRSETYETGRLTHGTANPASPDFNSLTDFIICGTGVEIRLPWQLLNFSNPAKMIIHDDYYQHYGAEDLHIDQLWVGIGREGNSITLAPLPLKGWNTHVTCHARLKQSYWLLQDHWTKEAGA